MALQYRYMRLVSSGEIYAIQYEDGYLVSAVGPLSEEEWKSTDPKDHDYVRNCADAGWCALQEWAPV